MGACNGKIPQGDESEQSSDAGGSGRSQSSPKRSIADPSAAEIEDAKVHERDCARFSALPTLLAAVGVNLHE